MRQVIKGDGTDGTAAAKAYLLAHDSILAQELYEFEKPALPASVAAPIVTDITSTSAFALTTHGWTVPSGEVIIPDPPSIPPLPYGAMEADPSSGYILRTTGSAFAGFFQPGDIYWDFSAGALYGAPGSDSPLARPRSEISRIFAVMLVAFSHTGPLYTGELQLDGAGFGVGILPAVCNVVAPTEFSSGLQDAGGLGHLPGGDIIGFDFTRLRFHVSCGSNGAAGECSLAKIGLRFEYATPGSTGSPSTRKFFFTDSNSPLTYAGSAYTPTNVKNDGFKSKIGLDVDSLQISWEFRGDEAFLTDPDTGDTILTYLQALQYGLLEGWWVRWRRVYMPTFGDCDSIGAEAKFRGKIAQIEIDRLTAKITVNSITDLFNRQIPQQLIEANNRSMQVGPGLPPDLNPDPAHWSNMTAEAGHGGTVTKIVARQTAPTADEVFAPGTFDMGYLWFQDAPFEGLVAQVRHYEVISGFNVFYLFRPLYIDPHAFAAKFYAFVPVPKDQTASGTGVELKGFPWVPLPEQAV
jgi:hypothetical protein